MNQYKTEQETFWAGQGGDDYTDRNTRPELVASNISLFSKIFSRTGNVRSAIEFGSNIGLNLLALRQLLPEAELSAIEINEKSVAELKRLNQPDDIRIYQESILDFQPDHLWEFVFTKGVLIHINSELLPRVYQVLYQSSGRYICIIEYYSPTPVEISYRGQSGLLFKRDFAGELLDMYEDLQLKGYGFVYHRDKLFPQDDLNWFLLEKRA